MISHVAGHIMQIFCGDGRYVALAVQNEAACLRANS
jgi:hypothetical protein